MMKANCFEKFLRALLPTFGWDGGGCPGDDSMSALSEGGAAKWASRAFRRHVMRCPACMGRVLAMRELRGAPHGPLFPARSRPAARWAEPYWKPALSAAAMAAIAIALYVGGSSWSQMSREKALRYAEAPQPPPAWSPTSSEDRAVPAAPAPSGKSAAPTAPKAAPFQPTRPTPIGHGSGDPVPPETADWGLAAPGTGGDIRQTPPVGAGLDASKAKEDYAPQPEKLYEPAFQVAEKDEAAPKPPGSVPSEVTSGRSEPAEARKRTQDTPSPAPVVGGLRASSNAASPEQKAQAEGGEKERDSAAGEYVKALCRSADPRSPRVSWEGRRFFSVDGCLVEEGLCGAVEQAAGGSREDLARGRKGGAQSAGGAAAAPQSRTAPRTREVRTGLPGGHRSAFWMEDGVLVHASN